MYDIGLIRSLKEITGVFEAYARSISHKVGVLAAREIENIFTVIKENKDSYEYEKIILQPIKESETKAQCLGASINALLETINFSKIGGDTLTHKISNFMRNRAYYTTHSLRDVVIGEQAYAALAGIGGSHSEQPHHIGADFPKRTIGSMQRRIKPKIRVKEDANIIKESTKPASITGISMNAQKTVARVKFTVGSASGEFVVYPTDKININFSSDATFNSRSLDLFMQLCEYVRVMARSAVMKGSWVGTSYESVAETSEVETKHARQPVNEASDSLMDTFHSIMGKMTPAAAQPKPQIVQHQEVSKVVTETVNMQENKALQQHTTPSVNIDELIATAQKVPDEVMLARGGVQ